jgi:protoporphyrinogen oxidase
VTEFGTPTYVLGAGPAGLTAGYRLAQEGRPVHVLEADEQVGGLARTVERDGYRFDLGGHRFFTKSAEVRGLWRELLGDEMLRRPRQSRIHYDGRFLEYPLNARDVVRQLGPVELARVGVSYAAAQVRPRGREDTFEQWVTNRFGRRLFELFFRSYTEKVWGVPTSELRAEWAAQRIRGLSLLSAARDAVRGTGGERHTTLIREFDYPRYGPGQMWEAMTARIHELGGRVSTSTPVTGLEVRDGHVVEVRTSDAALPCEHVISSLALRDVVALAWPAVPTAVAEAARGLRYRDFLTVALVLDGDDPFPDNWIYVHEPGVRVGRIQNYRSWSPWMVPGEDTTCLGLEYFCFAGDDLWSLCDDDLVALATDELHRLGLADRARVRGGHAIRVPKAYPMYDADYARRVEVIRGWTDGLGNLQQVGRNGLHRYNNSDHSMLTALRAVENLLTGSAHDLWAINADSVYLEEGERDEHPYRDARPSTAPLGEREPATATI